MGPSLQELERACQKPHWRELGSLLARRVARPLALYVTWLVVRMPVSAHAVTACAAAVGVLAAVLFGSGTARGVLWGAVALNMWYLLDHVDGQVARFRKSESVTGIYFDFMMHHIVHGVVLFALGYGIAQRTGELRWALAGAAFALGVLALGMSNDCLYKAFIAAQRRRLELPEHAASTEVAGRDPAGPVRLPRVAQRLRRAVQQICEPPAIVVSVTLLAMPVVIRPAFGLPLLELYVAAMALWTPGLALARVARRVWQAEPDRQYREWSSPHSSP